MSGFFTTSMQDVTATILYGINFRLSLDYKIDLEAHAVFFTSFLPPFTESQNYSFSISDEKLSSFSSAIT